MLMMPCSFTTVLRLYLRRSNDVGARRPVPLFIVFYRLLSPPFSSSSSSLLLLLLYDRDKMTYHRHYQMLYILSHIYSTDLGISILLDVKVK